MRRFRVGSIGSMSAWLPSRRSTEHQSGAFSIRRFGHCRSAMASGMVQAVDLPARLSFVNDMVGREDLMNAVALNSLLFNVARALGPALAGPLLEGLGPGLCFLANGLSYLAVLWALARMDISGSPPDQVAGPGPARGRASLLAGFSYLAGRPRLASRERSSWACWAGAACCGCRPAR